MDTSSNIGIGANSAFIPNNSAAPTAMRQKTLDNCFPFQNYPLNFNRYLLTYMLRFEKASHVEAVHCCSDV